MPQHDQTVISADATPVLPTVSPHEIRDELTEMVIRDLLGPAGGSEEELDQREDRVRERYLLGMLAPKSTPVEACEMDELSSAEKDDAEVGPSDVTAPPTDTMFPSSLGMSFLVEPDVTAIQIKAEWGRYKRIKSETQIDRKGNPANVWKRVPIVGEPQTIDLKRGVFGPLRPRDDDEWVLLQGKIRQSPNGWVVTLFLVNTQEEPSKKKDEAWVFQPKLTVINSGDSTRSIFVQSRNWRLDLSKLDPISREETETLEMLYRNRLEFAVGHGVSVIATLPEGKTEKALMLETVVMPQSEVPQQTPPDDQDDPNLHGLVLDMKQLAEMPKLDLIASLHVLESAYGEWIKNESTKIATSEEKLNDHVAAAQRAVNRCVRAKERMGEGIKLIE